MVNPNTEFPGLSLLVPSQRYLQNYLNFAEHKHFQRKINPLQLWRDNGFPSTARPKSITAVELTLILNLYLTSLLCHGRVLL